MPELPEVETVVRILDSIVKGKTIDSVEVFRAKNIESGMDPFISSLKGETFLSVSRRAKFILFHLTNRKVILSHLRMEGKYLEGTETKKHDIVLFRFKDGTGLRYNDVRKFGTLSLKDEDSILSTPPLSLLGPEPWDCTPKAFFDSLQKKGKKPIKECIMDQTLIAGVGNIYADESLYRAKIHPLTPANGLSLEESSLLLDKIQTILKEAIVAGGSTIRSYHPKAGVTGEFQFSLEAYGRENLPCPRCGFPMRKIFVNGRGTTFCPKCQHRPGLPFIVGVTGPIASGKSSVSAYLESKGYERIDADKIVHDLYQDPKFLNTLKRRFPKAFPNGSFDRSILREIVSSNNKAKRKLEDIIHPLVYEEMERRIQNAKNDKIVLDVPLLLGSPYEERCDAIIAVFADEKLRKVRLAERGIDPKEALALNRSFPKGEAKKKAAFVVYANGSLKELYQEIDRFGLTQG